MNDWSIYFNTDISLISIVLLVVCIALFVMVRQLKAENNQLSKRVHALTNEFRAMSSGQVGMGRKIRKVVDEIAQVEDQQLTMQENTNNKTYEQAGLLLSRGATIEEVVESCDIAPAEAELIAILRNSAPTHFRQPQASA